MSSVTKVVLQQPGAELESKDEMKIGRAGTSQGHPSSSRDQTFGCDPETSNTSPIDEKPSTLAQMASASAQRAETPRSPVIEPKGKGVVYRQLPWSRRSNNPLAFHQQNRGQSGFADAEASENITNYAIPLHNKRIYRFKKTCVWIGRQQFFPLPDPVASAEQGILAKLSAALSDVTKDMMAEQCRERDIERRDEGRRRLTLEIRMSGRRASPLSSDVEISPCLWILCGSDWCRKKVRKAIRNIELPRNLFSQDVEVHRGGPIFSAVRDLIPLEQLQLDLDRGFGMKYEDGIFIHYVEDLDDGATGGSICGAICCTTFVRDGVVVDQRVSRVGGIVNQGIMPSARDIPPLAMTTAHGMFDILERLKVEAEIALLSPSSDGSSGRTGCSYSSESEPEDDTDDDMRDSQTESDTSQELQELGFKDPKSEILDDMTPLVTQLGYSSSRRPLAGNLKTETKDGPIEAQTATQDTPSSKKPKKAVQNTGRVQSPEATNRSLVTSSLTRRTKVQQGDVELWTCVSDHS
ncbi:hypothetical protein C8034_v004968 [Colletotrichum sidae]|uniref:Uncharacterized protein n=1 Tax=Colletotrichum sidae TaxID=1347389 RepID=A0A4R8T7L9_9PEZI|nr:hypothetical protein C8034_v004968 [Colletotrichum sidae]